MIHIIDGHPNESVMNNKIHGCPSLIFHILITSTRK